MGPRPSRPMDRSVAIYNLGTIKRGDPGTFQLYITNTGEILLSVVTPTTTGQPELMKPRSLAPIFPGILSGHFLAYLTSGETVWVDVHGKKEFEKLKEMMNAFSPELLKVIE